MGRGRGENINGGNSRLAPNEGERNTSVNNGGPLREREREREAVWGVCEGFVAYGRCDSLTAKRRSAAYSSTLLRNFEPVGLLFVLFGLVCSPKRE